MPEGAFLIGFVELRFCGLVVRANGIPVHDAPKCLEIIRAPVLIFQVIGVLPNITAKNRRAAFHQRGVLIRRVANAESTVGFDAEPRPTATELGRARSFKFFLE